MGKAQEYKSFNVAESKVIDADQGMVEHIVAVMGNIDRGDDVIHPGAFSKSIMERGLKVKVLDQHDTRSVESVIGKPMELREVGRLELPPSLTDQYPDATGALVAKTQFLLDTNRGREAFSRIKSGAVDEYSIGYDPITTDYSTVERDGADKTVRNLRELRLWEYSPVVFGMNPATSTLSAKEDVATETAAIPEDTNPPDADKDAEPEEGKPYRVYEEDDQYCVYKLNTDGEPTGDSLGCHESAEEAQSQVRALYANEPEADEDTESDDNDDEEKGTEPEPVDTSKADDGLEVVVDGIRYVKEDWEPDRYVGEEKVGRILAARNARRLETALATLTEILKDAGMIEEPDEEEKQDNHDALAGELQAADDAPAEPEVGPVIPPTSERMALLRELEIELLEVELP